MIINNKIFFEKLDLHMFSILYLYQQRRKQKQQIKTSTKMATNQEYQGWKNRATWNVALYINNEYGIYQSAVEYVKQRRNENRKVTYKGFVQYAGLVDERTPDKFKYYSQQLDFKALAEMLNELVD